MLVRVPKRIPLKLSGETIACAALFLTLAVSSTVMIEPSPYELMVGGLLVGWSFFGLELRRDLLPLIVLLSLYLVGNALAVPQASQQFYAYKFLVISVFLCLSAILFAAALTTHLERLKWIERGYITAALFASFLAIAGYLNLFPGAFDLFTLYGRAKAAFKDPNVFGPFLLLPSLFLLYDILTRPLRENFFKIVLYLIIAFGIFLSFSRAAWAMMVFSSALMFALIFINERRTAQRMRMMGILGLAFVAVIVLLFLALSIDSIADMVTERAKLVQDYDGKRGGRFFRQLAGIQVVTENPWGIGPGEFARILSEDEHNVYLKGFTTYGWIGGFAYITLVLLTLIKATPLVFRSRPWQKYAVCTYSVFFLHFLEGFIIDSDHWRHFYLLLGILWAMIAAEKGIRRSRSFSTRTSQQINVQS